MKKWKVSIILALTMTLLSSTVVSATVQNGDDTAHSNSGNGEGTSRTERHRSGLDDIEKDLDSEFWDLIEYYLNRDLELYNYDTDSVNVDKNQKESEADDPVTHEDWVTLYEDALEENQKDKDNKYQNAKEDTCLGIIVSDGSVEGIVDVEHGAFVEEVLPHSAAEIAGIDVGDLITEINGKEIKSKEALVAEIARHKPYDIVTVTVTVVNPMGRYKKIDYTTKLLSKQTYNEQYLGNIPNGRSHK